MKRYLLYLCATALLTVACSGDDTAGTPSVGSTEQVAFSASVADEEHGVTRTPANAIETASALSTEGGFGVFGCYTGLRKYRESSVSPDFMYNEHVTWSNSTHTWEYTPLKYWPNGEGDVEGTSGQLPHYLSFFAYAPYSNGDDSNPTGNPAGYCIPSFSHQGELGNPWVTYRLHTDVTKQVDLLCADPLLDQTKPDKAERLTFQFKHALACVGDKVSISCTPDMIAKLNERAIDNFKLEVTKLEIVYTLTSKARLVLWNGGEPNWERIYSETPVCIRTVTLVDAGHPVVAYAVNNSGITTEIEQSVWNDKGVYYIPLEMPGYPQTAQVNLTYCVSTYSGSAWVPGTSKEGSVTINLNKFADTAYMPGKHLYINIAVDDVTMTFTVTAAIAPWDNGGSWGTDENPIEAI